MKKLLARKKVRNVGKAEIKIIAIVTYYTIVGVMALVNTTYFDEYSYQPVIDYIVCQSTGMASCQEELHILEEVFILATIIVMISFLPVVVILFSCDLRAFRTDKVCGLLSKRST